jgi:hypothetical protein
VSEKEIEIKTADGTCDAVLYEAEDGKRRPGVIHYPDIMGIRPSHRAMAKRLADQGYSVLLVNPFYRTVRGLCFDFPPNFAGDERTMKRFGELAGPLTPEVMERDATTFVNFLATQHSVSEARVGAVGYCFTGQVALRTAAARPDRVRRVRTSPCRAFRSRTARSFISATRRTTTPCRRKRSTNSMPLSRPGAASMKANSTRTRRTDGPSRTAPHTDSRRPSARSGT